jgi:hypothetical protein
MTNPTLVQMAGAAIFAIAVLHTFSTKFFEHLAHTRPAHAGLWHLLGEVEVVFGFWAMVLMVSMLAMVGTGEAAKYLDSRIQSQPHERPGRAPDMNPSEATAMRQALQEIWWQAHQTARSFSTTHVPRRR